MAKHLSSKVCPLPREAGVCTSVGQAAAPRPQRPAPSALPAPSGSIQPAAPKRAAGTQSKLQAHTPPAHSAARPRPRRRRKLAAAAHPSPPARCRGSGPQAPLSYRARLPPAPLPEEGHRPRAAQAGGVAGRRAGQVPAALVVALERAERAWGVGAPPLKRPVDTASPRGLLQARNQHRLRALCRRTHATRRGACRRRRGGAACAQRRGTAATIIR